MNLPTIRKGTNNNSLSVNVGPITVWFSYQTPVAFQVRGGLTVVRQNDWGPTTGKHLNAIDGGCKSSRVSGEAFQQAWAEQVEPLLNGAAINA
jgi:hypothetical protein